MSKIEYERLEPLDDGAAEGDDVTTLDAETASPDQPLEPGA